MGFTIHPVKSVFQRTQCREFLGFQLDSRKMVVSLTSAKAYKIRLVCIELIERQTCMVGRLAEVIGYLVAAHPGLWIAPVLFSFFLTIDQKLQRTQLLLRW